MRLKTFFRFFLQTIILSFLILAFDKKCYVNAEVLVKDSIFDIIEKQEGYFNAHISFIIKDSDYQGITSNIYYQYSKNYNFTDPNKGWSYAPISIAFHNDATYQYELDINLGKLNVGESFYVQLVYLPSIIRYDDVNDFFTNNNPNNIDAYYSDVIEITRKDLPSDFNITYKLIPKVTNALMYIDIKNSCYSLEVKPILWITDNLDNNNWYRVNSWIGLIDLSGDYTYKYKNIIFNDQPLMANTTYYYKLTLNEEIIYQDSFTTMKYSDLVLVNPDLFSINSLIADSKNITIKAEYLGDNEEVSLYDYVLGFEYSVNEDFSNPYRKKEIRVADYWNTSFEDKFEYSKLGLKEGDVLYIRPFFIPALIDLDELYYWENDLYHEIRIIYGPTKKVTISKEVDLIKNITLIEKESFQLKITLPEGTTVIWISDDPSVATVDSNGLVTAVFEGSTYIRARYNGEEVSCYVLVLPLPSFERNVLFDADYYLEMNPDLKGIYSNETELYKHWINNGIAEGRVASRIFNVTYYLEMNPDLAAVFNNDYKAAYQHYVDYGCNEFRPASVEYNGLYYMKNYSELAGMTNKELAEHYVKYGRAEGRVADRDLSTQSGSKYNPADYVAIFDVNYYRQNHLDIVSVLGDKEDVLLNHFIEYGIAEGRQGCATFNVNTYRKYNPDLVAIFGDDLTKYYLHYNEIGKNEGRIAVEKEQEPDSDKYNPVDYAAIFDIIYYKNNNPDIAALFGDNEAAILTHFIEYGIAEGRQGCATFNVNTYRKYNPDLVAIFGDDLAKYYLHYNEIGKNEGRIAVEKEQEPDSDKYNPADYAAIFDIIYYKNNNSDIAALFGDNEAAILTHFVDYGMAEGRQGSAGFNVWIYQQYNPDLVAIFGKDLKSYYLHYNQYGRYEGRIAAINIPVPGDDNYDPRYYADVFDATFYALNNPDIVAVLGQDAAALLRHFVDYGMSEGRQGSAMFNVASYMANNPDLVSIFGNNLKEYYMHYIDYGKAEGRIAQ